MRVVLNNSFIRINNALTKIGDTVTQFVEPLGQIFRIVNGGLSTTFTYTNIFGESVDTTIGSGQIQYILAQSGSLSDTPQGNNNPGLGIITITNLLITSSVSETPTFTEVLVTTVGNSTWVKPAGVTQVIAECWGGGGAGGGATINGTGGGGGSGGNYSRQLYIFPSEQLNLNCNIGTGGTGSTGNGTDGGFTNFNTILLSSAGNQAGGGLGGGVGTNENVNTAGLPNTDEILNRTYGAITYTGGGGQAGYGAFQIDSGGGGGGGAGSSTNGNNAVDNGIGGAFFARELGGAGGVGNDGISSTNGSPGSNYGGGGSGAYKASGGNRSGGDGAPGAIRIIYR